MSPNPLWILARNLLAGFGIATAAVTALWIADPGGLGGLLLRDASHPVPLALLWLFLGLTCGAVQFGIALQSGSGPPPPQPRLRTRVDQMCHAYVAMKPPTTR
ncbi:hypothetical protein ACLF3G_06270 [Falsiroseomonas sp. HC035]|uniref:hypothetical protein n=1 Tax=Falsiroseomonas sp. HC035 TaxID=3390999 RepID=UPI003D3128A0